MKKYFSCFFVLLIMFTSCMQQINSVELKTNNVVTEKETENSSGEISEEEKGEETSDTEEKLFDEDENTINENGGEGKDVSEDDSENGGNSEIEDGSQESDENSGNDFTGTDYESEKENSDAFEDESSSNDETGVGSDTNAEETTEEEIKNEIIEPKKRSWTIMLYMSADNELETYALQDLNEIESVFDEEDDVSVIALLDRSPGYDGTNGNWDDTRLFEIKRDNNGRNGVLVSEEIECNKLGLSFEDRSELDMGNPYTVSGFIDFCKEKYTAEKYCFVIWGHGSGWRGCSIDDTSNSCLSLPKLEKGIKGQNLDIVVFDCCFGMSLETLFQLQKDVGYIVGTAGVNSVYGLNYDLFLDSFYGTDKSEIEFVQSIINNTSNSKFSYIQGSEVLEISKAFEKFSASLSSYITSASKRNEIWDVIFNKVRLYKNVQYPCDLSIDIKSFAEHFLNFSNQNISRAAETLFQSIKTSEISIHLIPLVSANLVAPNHSSFYKRNNIENYPEDMICAYVGYSENWVPGNNGNSFLDKLFYVVFD